jgi:hypothetical protein
MHRSRIVRNSATIAVGATSSKKRMAARHAVSYTRAIELSSAVRVPVGQSGLQSPKKALHPNVASDG